MTENTINLPADNATVTALLTLIGTEMKAAGQQDRYTRYIEEFGVTSDNVNDHALALAALITEPGEQKRNGKRTKYGNALNTAKIGLRRNLPKDEAADTDWIRLVKQAAENAANKGSIDPEAIVAAVVETLTATA